MNNNIKWYSSVNNNNICNKNSNIKNNNNNDNQEKIQHREKISENGSAKSSDTRTDLSNQIYIMSDSIVKDVRDYELSYEVGKCIVYVKSFLVVDYKAT